MVKSLEGGTSYDIQQMDLSRKRADNNSLASDEKAAAKIPPSVLSVCVRVPLGISQRDRPWFSLTTARLLPSGETITASGVLPSSMVCWQEPTVES